MAFTNDHLLKLAHEQCSNNEQSIKNSRSCGCFYCVEVCSPDEIRDWIGAGDTNSQSALAPATAICPRCGVDSVIGDASGFQVDMDFLKHMRTKYFDSGCQFVVSEDDTLKSLQIRLEKILQGQD